VSRGSDGFQRNSLHCTRPLYDVTMLENNPVAAAIVRVGVTGSDVTSFSLDGDAAVEGLVRVHSRTGLVSARRSVYSLNFRSTDTDSILTVC